MSMLSGQKIELSSGFYQNSAKEDSIEIEKNLTPIYPTTSGLQQNKLKKIIENSLEYCDKNNLLKEESDVALEPKWLLNSLLSSNVFH